jgi:serine/threonine protein phosphatase PrpC
VHVSFWGATDVGRVRKRNEDHYLVDPHLGLAIVTDGVGGQFRGDIAAKIGCRVVREHLLRCTRDLDAYRAEPGLLRKHRVEERLREAVQLANTEVFRAGLALSKGRGMGCTMEVVLVLDQTVFLGHVGDARTYHIKDGRAIQLTDDHSVLQEKVRRGLITAEEAEKAPGKQVITRAVGGLPSVRVDTLTVSVDVGQRLLLVTDGVTRYLSAAEIAEVCAAGDARAAEEVVDRARTRGGLDNITAVLVAMDAAPPAEVAVTAVKLDELRSTALFESATFRELRLVCAVAEWQTAKAGRLLFREGQTGSEMYLLLEGEVAITRNGQHLDTVLPGSSFGEMALLDAPLRSASALVTQDARMIVIPKHRFEQLIRQDDGVAARIMWGLLQRLSSVVRNQNQRLITRPS